MLSNKLTLAALTFVLTVCAADVPSTAADLAVSPPAQYQDWAFVQVLYARADLVQALCEQAFGPGVYTACVRDMRGRGRVMILQNRCDMSPYFRSRVAQEECHELGHWNGWPEDHPQ